MNRFLSELKRRNVIRVIAFVGAPLDAILDTSPKLGLNS